MRRRAVWAFDHWQVNLVGDRNWVLLYKQAGQGPGTQSALTQPWLRHVQGLVQALYTTEWAISQLGPAPAPWHPPAVAQSVTGPCGDPPR